MRIDHVSAAAMNQLTKNLCCEWGPDGIRVNAVSPWYTLTPLAQQVLQNKEYEALVLSRTPLKRVAQTDEVSGTRLLRCKHCISGLCHGDKNAGLFIASTAVFCCCLCACKTGGRTPKALMVHCRLGCISSWSCKRIHHWAKHCCGRRL